MADAAAFDELTARVRACRICEAHLPYPPRPVFQAGAEARVLIIGQAPGERAHASATPWDDASGDRLRDWTGLTREVFYDARRVALVPMGFCFPGVAKTGDKPPRPECAPQWHPPLLSGMTRLQLILLAGGYAQARYLPKVPKRSMTEAVRAFAEAPAPFFSLPHPSWRNTAWRRKNPWFESDVIPVLRRRVAVALAS